MAYGMRTPHTTTHAHTTSNNNDNHAPSANHIRSIPAVDRQAIRFHSRSQSWSHTSWMQNQNGSARASSSSTMASIFSPMRVIQGIVPTLTDAVTGSNSSSRVSPTPQVQQRSQPIAIGSDLPTDTRNGTHVRTRSDVSSRHSRQSSAVEVDLGDEEAVQQQPQSQQQPAAAQENNGNGNGNNSGMEFLSTITWMEKALPFALLLVSKIMWDHRIGILVFVGLFGTFFHVNSTIRKQVALKERRLNRISLGIFLFLFANTYFIYFVFSSQYLHLSLVLGKPRFRRMDIWTMIWCVGITDFVVKFITMALKCLIVVMPRWIVNFRRRGKFFLILEHISQFYRMVLPVPQWYDYFMADFDITGDYFGIVATAVYVFLKVRMLFYQGKEVITAMHYFWKDTRYGRTPSKEDLVELGDACPICQEEMADPIELSVCKHIFCEECIVMWFDREQTCPMCRAKAADDPQWRDGSTQIFIQLF